MNGATPPTSEVFWISIETLNQSSNIPMSYTYNIVPRKSATDISLRTQKNSVKCGLNMRKKINVEVGTFPF